MKCPQETKHACCLLAFPDRSIVNQLVVTVVHSTKSFAGSPEKLTRRFRSHLGERALLSTPVPTAGFGWVRPPRSPPRGLRLLRRISSSRILLSLALIARRAAMVELRRVTVTAWFPPRYFWATYMAMAISIAMGSYIEIVARMV